MWRKGSRGRFKIGSCDKGKGSNPFTGTKREAGMERQEAVAWAAGLLEGEGSFLTKSGRHTPVVSCQMTDLDVLERLKSIFGGAVYSTSTMRAHYKKTWRWQVLGDQAEKAMIAVRPYMLERRQTAIDKVLKIWRDHSAREDERRRQLRAAVLAYKKDGNYSEIARRFGVSARTLQYHVLKDN